MRVAVVGSGVSGLVSAYILAKAGVSVVLYEKEDSLGDHAKTVNVDGIDLDLGFMVFNHVTDPNTMEFFERLGIEVEVAKMSFSVSMKNGNGYEWGSKNGVSSLFAQKRNAINPFFWRMIREILKFKNDVLKYLEELENNPGIDRNETLGNFTESRGYSQLFQESYLVPICGSIWSCPSERLMNFSAFSVLSFFRNHHLLELFGQSQWLAVKLRSHSYVNKVKEELESRSCQIRTSCAVQSVLTTKTGCFVVDIYGGQQMYDGCILGVHAHDALKLLGKDATFEESRVLGSFQYVQSDLFLHRDKSFMPQNPTAWSAWNSLGTKGNHVCLTYWLNVLQNIGDTDLPFLVTLNPAHPPQHNLLKWSTSHPVPTVVASKASQELSGIQGKRKIWFCGAYQGYGFLEDGLKAGMVAAQDMLGENCILPRYRKHMVPSLIETGARLIVTNFLGRYISTGCLILLEDGGTVFEFQGTKKKCYLKSVLKVHHPLFYWKVATKADLGLADAYINGDFSFVDEEGLLNLLLILIANRDTSSSITKLKNRRGWWTPMLLTAGIASAKYFLQHVLRQNTLTQARRNISRHYDLSNDLFSLFLDETMTYSCAIFKNEIEDLKSAQLRKISILIEKAKIDSRHEILEIGCGWGSFALEVVKQTGCKYTGITLSEEQLKFAERKVKEAHLEDRITFLLCDYRQLPGCHKYDRIISCEMLEAVGHEYMEEFFGCCESLLDEYGLFVLQFTSIPDERYEEYRRSSDFIKEYIFPGCCIPSLSRTIAAMAVSSRLCVEHIENIGIHFYQTLRYWRKNFMAKQSKILQLGFDDKFIRTWEYYFVYCAAGFKSHTLGNYQVVFSRPGNLDVFNNPYKGFPSAY